MGTCDTSLKCFRKVVRPSDSTGTLTVSGPRAQPEEAANWRSKNWSRSKEEIESVPAPAALRQHRARRPARHPSSGEETEVGGHIGGKSLSPHHRAEGQTGRHSSVPTPNPRKAFDWSRGGEKSPLHLCFGALAKSKVRCPGRAICNNSLGSLPTAPLAKSRGLSLQGGG